MKHKPYLIVSGVLFGLITFGQVMRLTFRIPVQIGEWNVPLWPSMIVVILAFVLFVWAFRLAQSQ